MVASAPATRPAMPRWVRKDDVPVDTLENEKKIAVEQAKRENKPEKIWDKIAQGKTQQFHQQFCLMEQVFVKPVEGSAKPPLVGQVVENVSKKLGVTLVPRRFVRLKVGEEE